MATPQGYSTRTLKDFVGHEFGASDPITVDQERINAFADVTGDHQWIHVDIERTKKESPFGGPVAHARAGHVPAGDRRPAPAGHGIIVGGIEVAAHYSRTYLRSLSAGRRPNSDWEIQSPPSVLGVFQWHRCRRLLTFVRFPVLVRLQHSIGACKGIRGSDQMH